MAHSEYIQSEARKGDGGWIKHAHLLSPDFLLPEAYLNVKKAQTGFKMIQGRALIILWNC